jgi:hypothetical protein
VKKNILLIFIIGLLLVGCEPEEEIQIEQLTTPTELSIDQTMLMWDSVFHATAYEVSINEDVTIVEDNYIVIEDEGTYSVSIVAIADGFIDSNPSETFEFTIDYDNDFTIDITTDEENKRLTWESVDDAIHYRIYINGTSYDTEQTEFSYADIDSGLLKISIQGIYPIGMTSVSEIRYIEHNLNETKVLSFQYSRYSTQNIMILNESITEFDLFDQNNQLLNQDDLIEINDYIEIKSEYILSQLEEQVVFYLYSGLDKYQITITLNDKTVPYIISSSKITVDGSNDIIFQFELFEGSFRQIGSTGITDDDYEINEQLLTIDQVFLETRFEEVDRISINYAIDDVSIIVGVIMIYQLNE